MCLNLKMGKAFGWTNNKEEVSKRTGGKSKQSPGRGVSAFNSVSQLLRIGLSAYGREKRVCQDQKIDLGQSRLQMLL